MNQLAVLRPDGSVPASAADSLRMLDEDGNDLLQSEKAESSRKAYETDFGYFAAWCVVYGLPYRPAEPQTVQRWITWLVRYRRLRPATIARRVAAIRHMHAVEGLPSPTDSDLVKRAVRAARRELGAGSVQKTALVAKQIGLMLDSCGDSLLDKRDRALIAIGFAAALRRSELVALQVEDLTFNEKGLDVRIQRSKGDQESLGTSLVHLAGSRTPV